MTYEEIINGVYNNIDEVDYDEQIEIIVKNAINEAYIRLCAEDVRLAKAYVPIVNGVATLPSNLISIVSTAPELGAKDYVVGNSIITNSTGIIEVLYSYVRDRLVENTDEPDLHDTLQNALVSFAHYKYLLHRKKMNEAQMLLNEYNISIYTYRDLVKNRDNEMTGSFTIQDVL